MSARCGRFSQGMRRRCANPRVYHGIAWACVGIQEILPNSCGVHLIFRGVIKGLTTSQISVDNPVDTTVKAVEERLPDGL